MLNIQRNTNDLITILISKLEDYSTNMANRIKINSIFSEFEEKTKNQLNEFITLSQMRYKGVKSGNYLQNILQNQKMVYNDITDKITKDHFYHTKEIDEEKKKLLKKTDIKKTEEINQLRSQIKQDTKNLSKYEMKIRERLLRRIAKKKMNPNLYQHIKSRLNYNSEPKFSFEQKRQDNEPIVRQEENLEEDETNKTDPIEETRQYFEELINEDEKKIKARIDNYNDYLIDVKSSHENGQAMKLNHKFNFLTEDIKMLAYKEENNINIVTEKKEDPTIDIVKLMRYTKRGRQSKWLNPSKPSYLKEIDQCLMDKTGSDFRSTRMTVKSEAEKVSGIDEVFCQKRETFGIFYKQFDLPGKDEYDELIRIKSGRAKANRSNAKLRTDAINQAHYKKNISCRFRQTYTDKAKLWRNQDVENELKKAREKEKTKEISNFLKEVKNTQRKPQYYIDCYSKKDNMTNQRLSQVNKSLGSAFNSQKEKKVFKYDKTMNMVKHNRIQTRKKNDELGKGEEVSKKIRENMKFDDLPEDVDITYKVFAQKIDGIGNKQISNPYEEFLEFKSRFEEKNNGLMNKNALLSPDLQRDNKSHINPKLTNNFDPLISPIKKGFVNKLFEKNINSNNHNADEKNNDMKFILVEKVNETLNNSKISNN